MIQKALDMMNNILILIVTALGGLIYYSLVNLAPTNSAALSTALSVIRVMGAATLLKFLLSFSESNSILIIMTFIGTVCGSMLFNYLQVKEESR